MDSSSCGKACLVGCLIFVALAILAGIGCFVCVYNSPLGTAMKNVVQIQGYFTNLQNQGWQVDDSQSNQPSGFGVEVETGQLMIWKARESGDDDWGYYVWEFSMADPQALEQGEWQAVFNLMVLPRTEEALDVHRELNLQLPDNFQMREWFPPDETDRPSRDRDTDSVREEDVVDDTPEDKDEAPPSSAKPRRGGR